MAGKSTGKGNGKKSKATPKYRSAISGHYVSEAYAKSHPKTTVKET